MEKEEGGVFKVSKIDFCISNFISAPDLKISHGPLLHLGHRASFALDFENSDVCSARPLICISRLRLFYAPLPICSQGANYFKESIYIMRSTTDLY